MTAGEPAANAWPCCSRRCPRKHEFALWLSAQVALPILHRLVENADSLADEGALDRTPHGTSAARLIAHDRHATARLAEGG